MWREKALLFLIRLFIDFLSHNFEPHLSNSFSLAVSNPLSLPSIDQCFNFILLLTRDVAIICFLPRNEYCTENWCSSLIKLPWSWCTAEMPVLYWKPTEHSLDISDMYWIYKHSDLWWMYLSCMLNLHYMYIIPILQYISWKNKWNFTKI